MRKIAQERWFEWKIILVLLLSRSHLGQAQSLSDTFAGGLQNGISQLTNAGAATTAVLCQDSNPVGVNALLAVLSGCNSVTRSSPPPPLPPPPPPPPSPPPPVTLPQSPPPPLLPPPLLPPPVLPPPVLPPPILPSPPPPAPTVAPSPPPRQGFQCPSPGSSVQIGNPDFNLTIGSSSPFKVPEDWNVILGSAPKYIFGPGVGFSFGSNGTSDTVSQNVPIVPECSYQLKFVLAIDSGDTPENSLSVTQGNEVIDDSSGSSLDFKNLAKGVYPMTGTFKAHQSPTNISFSGASQTGAISLHNVDVVAL